MNKFIGGSDGGCDMPSQTQEKIGYTDGAAPTPQPKPVSEKEKSKYGN